MEKEIKAQPRATKVDFKAYNDPSGIVATTGGSCLWFELTIPQAMGGNDEKRYYPICIQEFLEISTETETTDKTSICNSGSLSLTTSQKFNIDDATFTYNKNNPAHQYLVRNLTDVGGALTGIKFIYQDKTHDVKISGNCSLAISLGQEADVSITFSVMGTPTFSDYDFNDPNDNSPIEQ